MNYLSQNARLKCVLLCLTFIIFFACKQHQNVNKKIAFTAEHIEKLDSLFNAAVANEEIPGAVVHISFERNEIFHKAYGLSSRETGDEMEKNDIFRLASMTKGVTAVAILQLVEKGFFELDDALYKFIPEFKNPELLLKVNPDSTFVASPSENEITIRQLLTHTSGIGYGFQDDKYNALVLKNKISEGFCEDQRTSIENTIKIAKLPLLCKPGERNIYSMSYDVLGTLIEVVTKERFDTYVIKNILAPLEMNDSYFIVPKNQRDRLVSVYQPDGNGGLMPTSYPENDFPIADGKQFFSGGADLCATAKDFNKFVQMIRNKGTANGNRILGEKFIEMMLQKQTNLDDGNSDQGFAAWVVNEKGAEEGIMSEGSYGFGGFYDTYTWTDPKEKFIATLLLQMYPTNEHSIHEKYQKIVYEIINEIKKQ